LPDFAVNSLEYPLRDRRESLKKIIAFDRLPHQLDLNRILFWGLIALHLIPIFIFKYFPSQDGPSHLYNASILRHYFFPEGEIFRAHFKLIPGSLVDWLIQPFMAILMFVFPPLITEKIVLILYVILLPVSFRYVVRSIRPESEFLSVLIFPFINSYFFYMGFYNFLYGIIAFLFFLGYWINSTAKPSLTFRNAFTLTGFFLLTYFFHPVAWAMSALVIGVLCIGLCLSEMANAEKDDSKNIPENNSLLKNAIEKGVTTFLALLPSFFILLELSLKKKVQAIVNTRPDMPPPSLLWNEILHFDALTSFRSEEALFSYAYVNLAFGIFLYLLITKLKRRDFNLWDMFFLSTVVCITLYFSVPDISPPIFLWPRVMLYTFLILLLWFAGQKFHEWVKLFIQMAGLVITLALFSIHLGPYALLNNYLKEYVAVMQQIPANTTVVPLPFWSQPFTDKEIASMRIDPFLHASDYIGALKPVANLEDFEAAESDIWPVQFRFPAAAKALYWKMINERSMLPPHLVAYTQKSSQPIDYLIAWKPDPRYKVWEQDYALIYQSPGKAKTQLYSLKKQQSAK